MSYGYQDDEDGNDGSKKKIFIIIGAVILSILTLLFIIGSVMTTVSDEEYAQLHEGITYDQAVQIIGGKSRSSSDMSAMGMSVQSYEWIGDDGSTIVLMFEQGRLVSKAKG